MGVNLKNIVQYRDINIKALSGKVIAVDALNALYQFVSSIRQSDGAPLMNSEGALTSHLSGLFYRSITILRNNIKVVYVFDGVPPAQKVEEIAKRKKVKEQARKDWELAKVRGDIEDMAKYAKRTSKITWDMVDDAKELLSAMGIPYVQAPSEGEAQCAHIVKKDEAWACASQDYDALLLGVERLIRNLTGTKKELEIVYLDEVLGTIGITREQLIDIGILQGTDFNAGVKGIGPKKALKIVKENKLENLELNFNINEIRDIFLKPDVTDDYSLEWSAPDDEQVVGIMCDKYEFSRQRIKNALDDLKKSEAVAQKGLGSWF